MYWFNKTIITTALAALLGCTTDKKAPETEKLYFDVRGFFTEQIAVLKQKEPLISKTVSQGHEIETRSIKISDWNSELELFRESDINKSSWKNSYSVNKQPNTTEYLAKEEGLRTRKVVIVFDTSGNTVKAIHIVNRTKNILYSSTDTLDYYPDSLYSIKKAQKVKVIGSNYYIITGMLK